MSREAQTVAEVLAAAADLIQPEGAWTQHDFGRDMFGSGWDDEVPEMPDAVCWCALGAIATVSGADPWASWRPESVPSLAMELLTDVVGGPVAGWNDSPFRTQEEVVEALRAAAVRAEDGQ